MNAASTIRVGVSPLSWVNEVIPEFGAGTSAETILSQAKTAGFAGVETSRAFPKDAENLKALLSKHGLALVSGWHSGFLTDRDVDAELDAVKDHAELLAACGSTVMVYGECGHMADNALDVPMSQRLKLDGMKSYGERLTRFAIAVKARHGLDLAYHHHLMMVAETYDEVAAVMHNSGPETGLLLDTGHTHAGGFDYARLIGDFSDRIRHIHLKDVRGDIMAKVRARDMTFNEGVRAGMFTIPGDGAIDFTPLASFLTKGTYSGWVLVEAEQNPELAPPGETVARAFRFVSQNIIPA